MKSLTKIIMTIIVVLVMTVGAMIPIFGGLEKNIVSVDQNTEYRYILKENHLDLEVECTSVGQYLINGNLYTGASNLLIIGDGLYIYLYTQNFSIVDTTNNLVTLSTVPGKVISIDSGSYTYTNSDTTYTGTVETLLYPSPRGDYGAFTGTGINFYTDIGEEIYIISNLGNPNPKFVLTIKDGVEIRSDALVTPITTNPYAAFTGSVTATITSELAEDGLSRHYTGISVSMEGGNTNYTPIVYAPIVYHTIDGNAEAVRSIVNMLPILIMLGLVIVAGYAIIAKTRGDEL